jgi:hypothetical protein
MKANFSTRAPGADPLIVSSNSEEIKFNWVAQAVEVV